MEKPIPLEHLPAAVNHLFESLFNEHWSRIFGYLSRLTSNPDEAEDLCLETFVRLHQQLPRLNTDQNPGGWLYRTATRLGWNALRASRRRTQYEMQAFQILPPDSSTPADALESKQEQEMVRRVLSDLKPRDAQLLLLRSSGFSYLELAEACQVSPGSVGTLLSRAEREFEKRYRARFGG